jgi:hypothetical protein
MGISKHPARFAQRHLLLCSCALLFVTASCASNEINTPNGNGEGQDQGWDMSQPPEEMGSGDMSSPPPVDMATPIEEDQGAPVDEDMGDDMGDEPVDMGAPDQGLIIDYTVCAIGAPDPSGECLSEDTLDFGAVPDGMSATLAVRISNRGTRPISVTAITTPPPYASILATYAQPDQPPSEVTLPHDIEGEDAYVLVTLQGSDMMGALEDGALEVTLEVGPEDERVEEMASIVLRGSYSGCAPGFANCDGLPGCETDTS